MLLLLFAFAILIASAWAWLPALLLVFCVVGLATQLMLLLARVNDRLTYGRVPPPRPAPQRCPRCRHDIVEPVEIRTGYCPTCRWWTRDPQLAPLYEETHGHA